jgi:NitT/TauT family transport system substrate-binding protein
MLPLLGGLRRPWIGLAVVILAAAAVGCSGPANPDEAGARTFTLGLIPGAQSFIDFVMDRHGILDQVGLKAERVESLSPANLHLMIAERQVDIGFAGFTTMATARSQGKDVIVIGGVFSPVNKVFVQPDSPIKALGDLRGRKLGIFGGPGSTTFMFLAVLARNWHGIDLQKEVELVTAPGPALVELLERGDIDAALLGTTESIQLSSQGRFAVLTDLSDEYRQRRGGRAPAHVTVATNEQFAQAHADVVRDYMAAYSMTLDYIDSHPEVWDEYGPTINMSAPGELALLREMMGPNLTRQWDRDQIDVQNQFLQLVHDIMGPDVLAEIPPDLIRDDYRP